MIGMAECLTPETMERYRGSAGAREAGGGSPAELLAVEEHLAACPAGRGALQMALQGAAASVAGKLAPAERACLEDEAMTRYVAGESDAAERDAIEAHASRCARCAEDLTSLRAFSD